MLVLFACKCDTEACRNGGNGFRGRLKMHALGADRSRDTAFICVWLLKWYNGERQPGAVKATGVTDSINLSL